MKKSKKYVRLVSLFLAKVILITSCVSTTVIQSQPRGAKVFLDNQPVGTTPYRHSDTRIVGSCISVELEKEGYETLYTNFCRDEEADVGAIIGGIFFLFPFLWTMKYKDTHYYELSPENEKDKTSGNQLSKAERLRELNQLLEEGIITQEEFEREKKEILEEK